MAFLIQSGEFSKKKQKNRFRYRIDFEKVSLKCPVLFRKIRAQAKNSLGSEKLITIFAIAKRIRV
jgi:hypothetical protein